MINGTFSYICKKAIDRMKRKKKANMRITLDDFMLANRKAAREEEIALHGKPISSRSVLHKSRKIYDRKRLHKIETE